MSKPGKDTVEDLAAQEAAEDAELREMALKLEDPGNPPPKPEGKGDETPEGDKPKDDPGASDKSKAAKEKGSKDEKPKEEKKKAAGSEKPATESTKKDEEDLEEREGDSEYVKAQKAKKREAKTWKQINSEKEKLEADRKLVEAEKASIQRERELINKLSSQDRGGKKGRWSAEQYEAAAREFEAEGNAELAAEARAKAKAVREAGGPEAAAAKTEQVERAKAAHKEHIESWNKNFDELCQANPDLEKADSELHKETLAILQRAPELRQFPKGAGIKHAVQIALWKLGHDSVAGLKESLAEALKRAEEAEGALGIPRSTTSPKRPSAPSKRSALEMTEDEEDAEMKRKAELLESPV